MSLSFGRSQLAMPGPSNIPDRVLQAMMRPAPNIYAGDLVEMTDRIIGRLKEVARTKGDVGFYITNGHGLWDAALSNILSRGDKVLVVMTGKFPRNWANAAKMMGIEVEPLICPPEKPVDPARLAKRLRADRGHEIKAVLLVQTDTASSVLNDVAAVGALMRAGDHPALLVVDCIASMGCDEFHMDEWGVDVALVASQKGLMTPPGLGFCFIGPHAWEQHERAGLRSPYWDWSFRCKGEFFYHTFCGTAPTHLMFALDEALKMLVEEEGIHQAWLRHALMARAVWAALDVWAQEGALSAYISERSYRSCAVTTIRSGNIPIKPMLDWCEKKAGLVVGVGLDPESPDGGPLPDLFRIGHMGHLNPPMLLGALGTIGAALKACDIPHGSGALEAAEEVLAAG